MTLPKTNLTASAIKDVLNQNGGNVTTNIHTFFTPDAKICVWARFKPVRLNADFTDMDFYTAEDGNCGLYVKSVNHPSLIADVLDGEMNGWVYQLPRGKSYNEPYRLGDFRGYNPNANKMFLEYDVPSEGVKGTSGITISMVVTQDSTDDRDYLIPADLSLADCFFGVYIVGSGANCVKTNANTIGDGFATVTIDTTNFITNYNYTVYPFLCTSPISTQTTTIQSGTYYPIPFTNEKSFVVKEPVTTQIVDGSCTVRENSNVADYHFTIKHGVSGTAITNAYVVIKNVEGVTVTEKSLGTIGTVSADGTFTYVGEISIDQSIVNAGQGYLWITCKHGNVGLDTKNFNNGKGIEIAFPQPMD